LLTLRSSIGYATKPINGFSISGIAYNVTQFVNEAFDTQRNDDKGQRPVIADPQDTDIHNLYLQYKNGGHQFRLGRQNLFLDNWRMIGDVRFRQNWQVFDGFTYTNTALKDTKIFYAFLNKQKTVTIAHNDIESHLVNANYKLTKGTSVTGYGYFTEFEEKAQEGKSDKTIGLRLNGKEKINDTLNALFTAEYAKQTDYKDGADADARYYMLSGGLGIKGWDIRLNKEFLEGNGDGKQFQPHFGTNHLFTGWADLFLGTPAQGIDDTFVSVVGKLMGAKIKMEYHMIDSDESVAGDDEYGNEFDLGVYYKFKKNIIGAFEYANFKADKDGSPVTKPDTEKMWFTGIYKF